MMLKNEEMTEFNYFIAECLHTLTLEKSINKFIWALWKGNEIIFWLQKSKNNSFSKISCIIIKIGTLVTDDYINLENILKGIFFAVSSWF